MLLVSFTCASQYLAVQLRDAVPKRKKDNILIKIAIAFIRDSACLKHNSL